MNVQEEAEVVRALRNLGFDVESVYDLVNTRRTYGKAIPLLVELLGRISDSGVKEGIVRALTVKEARGGDTARALIRAFEKEDHKHVLLKWAIGNALSVVADESVFHDVLRLAKDKAHGKAREMLVVALGNMPKDRAIPELIRLLDEQDVVGYAIIALGRLKAYEAKQRIQSFLQDNRGWVRKEAQKALNLIEAP